MNIQSINDVDITNKIIVIRVSSLAPQFHGLRNRLYRATGGFGCVPACLGKAVFTEALAEPFEHERWNRNDVEGWITDEEYQNVIFDLLSKE